MAKGEHLLRVVRPRVVLPASAAVWTAAEVLHLAQVSAVDPALVSAAVSGIIYGTRARPATGLAVAAGAWLTASTMTGPLAGPYDALTLLWAAMVAAGLIIIHRHEAVKAAKEWRTARLEWLGKSHRYGLGNSHLLEHERTRLGERRTYDVTETGKLASQVAAGSLAERIAQDEMLPRSRVQVRESRIAGRVEVSIRHKDPWKHPVTHPVLDPDPELELPVPCTIREPLPVGQDPETGHPLTLPVWDETGGKVIVIVGKRGAGKTVLLSCIRERLTAANDAFPLDINLSKGLEDDAWAPLMIATARGRPDRRKALRMLRIVHRIIDERGAIPREKATFVPGPAAPLVVVLVDEIDSLTVGNDGMAAAIKAELTYIATKGRSEGITLIIAGQRGTAAWLGGSDLRSQLDIVCLGKVGRAGEIMHAAGDMGLVLPDMATYGEGHPGVWVIAEAGGDYEAGRTFDLHELTDIRKIAAARMRTGEPGEPVTTLEPHLMHGETGRALAKLLTDDARRPQPPAADPGPRQTEDSSGIGHLDQGHLEEALPDDLREQLARIDAKNDDTRRLATEAQQVAASTPHADPEKLRESAAERWRQAAEQEDFPEAARESLIAMLAGEWPGMRKAAERFGVSLWTLRCWLERLRLEGIAEVTGKKGGARWRLADRPSPDGQADGS